MNGLLQDIRYGFRMGRRAPGFVLIAILTLALGIGANTAVFTVINGVLLRPLPYPESDRLVVMESNRSRLDVEDFKERIKSMEPGGAVTIQPMDFTGGREPVRIQAALLNADLFQVLRARPLLGRVLGQADDQLGGPASVVLFHSFWREHFGADPQLIGKTIRLSGQSYTVVGVMPADFALPRGTADVLASLRVVYPEAAKYRGVHFMRTYWRLRPEVNLAEAQAEMPAIDRALEQLYPDEDKGRHTQLTALRDWLVGSTRPALWLMFGAVGLVLLVACSNFAGLLLARSVSRRREMAVRAALGGGRLRLIRQTLTETVLLAVAGGCAGLLLAHAGVEALLWLKPANLPRLSAVTMDWRVFLFGLAASVLTGIAFGLAPAWQLTRSGSPEALKEAGRGASDGTAGHRLRNGLVVFELALALLLLTGAGLLVKVFWKLRSVDPGFYPENLLSLQIQLPEARYGEVPRQTAFRRQVLEGLNALPGASAAMVSELPMDGGSVFHNVVIEGQPPLAPGSEPEIQSRSVMGDYFRVMQIPLLAGRELQSQDREGSPLVAVINAAAREQFFPGKDPVGARFRWARMDGPPQWITIVGVVADVRHFGLDRPEEPAVYTSYAQSIQPWKRWMVIVVRTRSDPEALGKAARNVVWSVDDQIPVSPVRSMIEVMGESLAERRFNTTLLGSFAALALGLAAVGTYGLVSYSVTQRTHEIGVRMALGADPGKILKLMLREGLVLVVAGVVLGLIAACGLTRLMASMLFAVRATDLVTYASVSVLLALVALIASCVPAMRAAKVDPMVALRYE